MAAARRTEEPPPARSRRVDDTIGLALFFFGLASLVWLIWRPDGPVANVIVTLLRETAGVGSYAMPLLLMAFGVMFIVGRPGVGRMHAVAGVVLAYLTLVGWVHVAGHPPVRQPGVIYPGLYGNDAADLRWSVDYLMSHGGVVGASVGSALLYALGAAGSHLVFAFASCTAIMLILDRSVLELLHSVRRPVQSGAAAVQSGAAALRARQAEARPTPPVRQTPAPPPAAPRKRPLFDFHRHEQETPVPALDLPEPEAAPKKPAAPRVRRKNQDPAQDDAPFETDAAPGAPVSPASAPAAAAPRTDAYSPPPLDLLRKAQPIDTRKGQSELADKIQRIEQTLDEFGIGANVAEIAHGPTFTRYEVQLAPGIKVAKIVSLADNIAMKLKAIQVRVEAPIPGKDAIGIEVPNSNAGVVSLRECLETPDFRNSPKKLLFALGKTVEGQVKIADLSTMPHLLVGGTTNSGKSVCLNALIASIVYRALPSEVKFVMIDPKMVELSLWDGIPHLIHPVVRNVKAAPAILNSVLREMEQRYETFSRLGVRNIDSYNAKAQQNDKLPYIVVIVDELADLMMTQESGDVEHCIARIAAVARATGIHLVIATQRPSADVLTGLIKANISSRIAFMVSSQLESRIVLDQNGAEKLIGRGDMLYMPIDTTKPIRIQGCYLSEAETNDLVAYLRTQEAPQYSLKPVEAASKAVSGGAGEDDEYFERAVRLVVATGHASASMLQRRFGIGYARSARLVDIMEQRGIVGPQDGAKPREIRISRDEVEMMFGGVVIPEDDGADDEV
jgi:S-DNA-T family DNA segregation ATPase FtsK/SpoIIIE